jgi:Ca2+-binding EF-hand superfamily protein
MRKLLPLLLMFMAAIALPQILQAEDSPKPERPNPESMFKRLDANKDGVITTDEIPAGMPERLKQMLIKADKNGDKQLTLDELKQAFKDRRPEGKPEKRPEGKPEKRLDGQPDKRPEGRSDKRPEGRSDKRPEGRSDKRPEGQPEKRPDGQSRKGPPHEFGGFGGPGIGMGMGMGMGMQRREGWMGGRGQMGPPSRPEGRPGPEQFADRPPMPPRGEGRPDAGLWQRSLQGIRSNLPEMPNLRAVFDRMDNDKDGKLCFEEFKTGMVKWHQIFVAHLAGNPAPADRLAGRPGDWQPNRGPHYQGYAHHWHPGPQGWGSHHKGHGDGWQPNRGPQYHGYAHQWHPGQGSQGHGYQFHGYAMNGFPGHGPQFQGHGPHGPGPQRGPHSEGHGSHYQGPWQE